MLDDLPRLVDPTLGEVEHHRPVPKRRLGRDQAGQPRPLLRRTAKLPQLGGTDPPAGQLRHRVEQPPRRVGRALLGVVGWEAEDRLPARCEGAEVVHPLAGQPQLDVAEDISGSLREDWVDRRRRRVGPLGHAEDVDAVEGHPGDRRDRPRHHALAELALRTAPGDQGLLEGFDEAADLDLVVERRGGGERADRLVDQLRRLLLLGRPGFADRDVAAAQLERPAGQPRPAGIGLGRPGAAVHLLDPAPHLLGGARLRSEVVAERLGCLVVLLVELLDPGAVLVELALEPVGPLLDPADDACLAADPVPLRQRRTVATVGERAEPVEHRAAGEPLPLQVEQPEQAAASEALRDRLAAESDPRQLGRLERFSDKLLVGLLVAVDERRPVERDPFFEVGDDATDRRPNLLAGVGRHQDLGIGVLRRSNRWQGVPLETQVEGDAPRVGVGIGVLVEPAEARFDPAGPGDRVEEPDLVEGEAGGEVEHDRAPVRQQRGAITIDRLRRRSAELGPVVEAALCQQPEVLVMGGHGDARQLTSGGQPAAIRGVDIGLGDVVEERLERADDRAVLSLGTQAAGCPQRGANGRLFGDGCEWNPSLGSEDGSPKRFRDAGDHLVPDIGVAGAGEPSPKRQLRVLVGNHDRERTERIGPLQLGHYFTEPSLSVGSGAEPGGADRHSEVTRLATTGSRWVTGRGSGSSTVKYRTWRSAAMPASMAWSAARRSESA